MNNRHSQQTHLITFIHNKGGTGKTTACLNIAGCLVKQQQKVLVVDLDPQGSATTGLGLDRNALNGSVYDVLMGKADIGTCIFEAESNIYILPSAIELLVIEKRLGLFAKVDRLKKCLASVKSYFDYILIDVPAGHTSLMSNGIMAADHLIIPMDCGVFAYESLETLYTFLTEMIEAYGLSINLIAILLREDFHSQTVSLFWNRFLKQWKGEQSEIPVSQSEIANFWEQQGMTKVKIYRVPYSPQIVQAQRAGLPISHYAPDSKIAQIYQQITAELDFS